MLCVGVLTLWVVTQRKFSCNLIGEKTHFHFNSLTLKFWVFQDRGTYSIVTIPYMIRRHWCHESTFSWRKEIVKEDGSQISEHICGYKSIKMLLFLICYARCNSLATNVYLSFSLRSGISLQKTNFIIYSAVIYNYFLIKENIQMCEAIFKDWLGGNKSGKVWLIVLHAYRKK